MKHDKLAQDSLINRIENIYVYISMHELALKAYNGSRIEKLSGIKWIQTSIAHG